MDDAVGEAFDKVAKMMWGPYPWWLWIDTLAKDGKDDKDIQERVRQIDTRSQFSFSWIKSQVRSLLDYYEREHIELDDTIKANIAWRFQQRVTQAMLDKLEECISLHQPASIGIAWGVSANSALRKGAEELWQRLWLKTKILLPTSIRYCVDNAAMIAVPGILTQVDL